MKKLLTLTSILVLISASITFAAPGDTLWTRTYGGALDDYAYTARQTSDGGYILAGYTESYGAGLEDLYLVKTDSYGDTVWTRIFGGSSSDVARSVQQTADGGYIIAGWTTSFGAGGADFYVVRTDSSGDSLWTRTYGGGGAERAYSVQQTSDGGYIIAGDVDSWNFYVVKTDSAGNTIWSNTYGGSSQDRALSIQQTADGGYIIAGYTHSFGAGGHDFYLVKTDASGNTQWTQTYGGTTDERAYSVQQTSDGGYIVAGWTLSFGAGAYDFYVVKTDASGNSLWTRTYGGTSWEKAFSIQQTHDEGYIIAGYTNSFDAGNYDFYVIKTNSSGYPLWTETYGGISYEEAWSVQQTAEGGFIVAGRTHSFGAGGSDFYLVKVKGDNLPPEITNITRNPDNPGPGEPCEITVTITDDVSVDSAFLCYDTGSGYGCNTMTNVADSTYVDTIPGQSAGIPVGYYIIAWDNLGVFTVSDTGSYYLNHRPEINNIAHNPQSPNPDEPCVILATITDSDGIIDSAFLHYDSTGSGYNFKSMNSVADTFSVTIEGQPGNSTVLYYVIAWDDLGDSTVSDTNSYYVNRRPVIADINRTPPTPKPDEACGISATITDPLLISSVESALLCYDVGSGYVCDTMSSVADSFYATIPGQPEGTIVCYYIYAIDNLGAMTSSDTSCYYVTAGNIVSIYMVPMNPPIEIPPGGNFKFVGILQNNTPIAQVTDVWIMMDVPGMGQYGPVARFDDLPLTPYRIISSPAVTQAVPVYAPVGVYEYTAFCGSYSEPFPELIIDSASFQFTVAGSALTDGADAWTLSGWFDGEDNAANIIPTEFGLVACYPNPFNAVTKILFDLSTDCDVRLEVYNLRGQKVAVLVDGHRDAGRHAVEWDGSGFSSGIYFYKLTSEEFTQTRRMTLLK